MSLALVLGAPCSMMAQSPCPKAPLGFNTDIRLPDAWELVWESTWPDARQAMAFWREDNFKEVQELWMKASPCLTTWQASVATKDLPASARWLPALVFETPVCGSNVPCGCPEVPAQFWSSLEDADSPEGALTSALAFGSPNLSAERVRTGVRLLENLDLPAVHVVQPGETVYSISRLHLVNPTCLGHWNGVWDNLQPGMHLRIPSP